MSNRQERRKRVRTDDRTIEVTGGPVQEVPTDLAGYDIDGDIVPGEHLWIVVASFRVTDPVAALNPATPTFLDLENMVGLYGPGCYVCECNYGEDMAARPCPGKPTPAP